MLYKYVLELFIDNKKNKKASIVTIPEEILKKKNVFHFVLSKNTRKYCNNKHKI